MEAEKIKIWDEYDEAGIGVGTYTDRVLFTQYNQGRVLDLGCGRGAFLASLLNQEKFGVDASARAIDTAKGDYPGIDFQVAGVDKLPFPDNFFDFVYSLDVIEHVKDFEPMIAEAYRVVKPGGYLYIQTPNYPTKRFYDLVYWLRGKRPLADDYTHVSYFSARRLAVTVGKLFKIERVRGRNIMFGGRIKLLEKLRTKGSALSRLLAQKTIVVGQKRP